MEKEIWKEQLKQEGKPEEIVEKILLGEKRKKYREEYTVQNSTVCKNPDMLVKEYVASENAIIESFFSRSLNHDFRKVAIFGHGTIGGGVSRILFAERGNAFRKSRTLILSCCYLQ